jgi:hypothetical protein
MTTNYERCAREIKYRVAMAKAEFNKKARFTSKLKFKEETIILLHVEPSLARC